MEYSPPSGSDRPFEQEPDGDTNAARQEYEGHRLSQAERQDAGSEEPSVLLDEAVLGNTSDSAAEGNFINNV